MKRRSQRNARRFGPRRANRRLALAGGDHFMRMLQRDPERGIVLNVPRAAAIARGLLEDVRRLGGVPSGEKDVYQVLIFGRDL